MTMATRRLIESIRGEYERYKSLAEGAIAQMPDGDLVASRGGAANSIATICWHSAGNLRSRFTNFLTEGGEKHWRTREEEFNAWYREEHLPGLAAVPGTVGAYRFLRPVGRSPRYVACYDLLSPQVNFFQRLLRRN